MQCFFCLISAQFALIFSHFDLSLAVLRETSTLCLKKDPCIRESSWINNTLSISMTSLRCILYWLCLYTSMPAVYLYFVQFIHDLCSQLPGVKGWKLEGQINVHCWAKPVTSHSHVNLHAEEGQSCTEGGECSDEWIKAFPVMEGWNQAPLDVLLRPSFVEPAGFPHNQALA